jgi:hypothetical protein
MATLESLKARLFMSQCDRFRIPRSNQFRIHKSAIFQIKIALQTAKSVSLRHIARKNYRLTLNEVGIVPGSIPRQLHVILRRINTNVSRSVNNIPHFNINRITVNNPNDQPLLTLWIYRRGSTRRPNRCSSYPWAQAYSRAEELRLAERSLASSSARPRNFLRPDPIQIRPYQRRFRRENRISLNSSNLQSRLFTRNVDRKIILIPI